MTSRVNVQGYLERVPNGCGNKGSSRGSAEKTYRNWFIVKNSSKNTGYICLPQGKVYVGSEFIGKRVRFRMEVE